MLRLAGGLASPDHSRGGGSTVCGWRGGQLAVLRVPEYAGCPAGGPGAGGSTGPWVVSFPGRRDRACWSGCLGQGGDLLPGGGDVAGPGPGGGDPQLAAASAADEPGGGMQDAVAQWLRLGLCP